MKPKHCVVSMIVAGWLMASCQDGTGPTVPVVLADASGSAVYEPPEVLRQSPTGPPLEILTSSAWIVRGERNTIRVRYASLPGDTADSELVRLDFHDETLLSRPDGSPIADGDSILVTVTIDPVQFSVSFAPTGLTFDPERPARFRLRYHRADPDLDGNGIVDAVDEQIRVSQLRIWLAPEVASLPWEIIAAEHSPDSRKFDVDLLHFSNYALAW
jgi:hypothetical protein